MEELIRQLKNVSGGAAVLAVGIILLSVFLAIVIVKKLRKHLERVAPNWSYNAKEIICRCISLIIILALYTLAFKILKIEIAGSILLLALVVTIIVTTSKSALQNIAAGLYIQGSKMCRVGDYIKLNECEGIIENIGVVATLIVAKNGIKFYVPSSEIAKAAFSFSGQENPYLHIISVPVSTRQNADEVCALLKNMMRTLPNAIEKEKISVGILEIEESRALYECTFYCRFKDKRQAAYDFNNAVAQLHEKGQLALDIYPNKIRVIQETGRSADRTEFIKESGTKA